MKSSALRPLRLSLALTRFKIGFYYAADRAISFPYHWQMHGENNLALQDRV